MLRSPLEQGPASEAVREWSEHVAESWNRADLRGVCDLLEDPQALECRPLFAFYYGLVLGRCSHANRHIPAKAMGEAVTCLLRIFDGLPGATQRHAGRAAR